MEPITLKLGGWYEVVTDNDHIYVGQLRGYHVYPREEGILHTLYLDGVTESRHVAIDLTRIVRVREVAELHLHINSQLGRRGTAID